MTSNNKKHIKASITAVGGYLPEDSISNKDLETMVDTSVMNGSKHELGLKKGEF